MSFDRPPSATTRSAPLRRIVKRAATVVAAITAVLTAIIVVLAVAAGALLAGFANANFGYDKERKHLAPIPIAASACPYVALMHEAANRFQIAYPVLGGVAYDAHEHRLTWPQTRTRLSRATDVLEFSIAAGMPHVPAPVRHYLEVARTDLHAGRPQLLLARDGSDFSSRTSKLVQDGETAFGFAGDLIGRQCAVQLEADTDTLLYPFSTTSPTSPPSRSAPGSPRTAGS